MTDGPTHRRYTYAHPGDGWQSQWWSHDEYDVVYELLARGLFHDPQFVIISDGCICTYPPPKENAPS